MSRNALLTLAEHQLSLGLIDICEFNERLELAHWISHDISSEQDPRATPSDAEFVHQSGECAAEPIAATAGVRASAPGTSAWMELLLLGKWIFARSDPDPYPSLPHGHLQHGRRPWPKLNPYTGRVFSAKHREDVSLRLDNSRLRRIWADAAFRDFCRIQIVWYTEANPHFVFPVRHPLRLPRR